MRFSSIIYDDSGLLTELLDLKFAKKQIIAHSFDFLDLLKIGDIVNNKKIINIIEKDNMKIFLTKFGIIKKEKIKTARVSYFNKISYFELDKNNIWECIKIIRNWKYGKIKEVFILNRSKKEVD